MKEHPMMTLSTKGRYATRMLTYMAARADSRPATKQEIADNEALSADYAEQILLKLKAAGLVRSHRGKAGGFSLAEAPEKMTVARVLRITEGPLCLVPCVENNDCERAPTCPTRPLWEEATRALDKVFSGTTIADLARERLRLQAMRAPAYEI